MESEHASHYTLAEGLWKHSILGLYTLGTTWTTECKHCRTSYSRRNKDVAWIAPDISSLLQNAAFSVVSVWELKARRGKSWVGQGPPGTGTCVPAMCSFLSQSLLPARDGALVQPGSCVHTVGKAGGLDVLSGEATGRKSCQASQIHGYLSLQFVWECPMAMVHDGWWITRMRQKPGKEWR